MRLLPSETSGWGALSALLLCVACNSSAGKGDKGTSSSGVEPATSASATVGSAASPKCLGLVNGSETKDHSSTVLLMTLTGRNFNFCTGSFISPTAVLTAGHCLADTTKGGNVMLIKGDKVAKNADAAKNGIYARNSFHLGVIGPDIDPTDSKSVHGDVAILLFPAGLTSEAYTLGTSKPLKGTEVTMVGYGSEHPDDQEQNDRFMVRRTGTNRVTDSLDGVRISVGGQTAAESGISGHAAVLTAHGDSGGPLLVAGQLVGVLSTGIESVTSSANSGAGHNWSQYIDITSNEVKGLIAAANTAGAGIPAPGAKPEQGCK